MKARATRGGTIAVLVLAAAAAGASDPEPPRLRFDPFARPDLAAMPGVDAPAALGAAAWAPVLNGTLVSGKDSLANLGGIVLGLGEQAHGYTLVEVRAFEAIFEHAGEKTVLSVRAREARE